jgi:hypothetical protein
MRRPRFLAACWLVLSATFVNGAEPNADSEAAKAAADALRKLGGNVIAVAQNDPRLDVTLNLAGDAVTDEALTHVAQLPSVIWLNLAGTKITDAGLAKIAGMKSLEKLHLEKTLIGDEGLAHLAGLENLTYLNIYSTQVTDAGLKHLHGLKKLKNLYIWQSKVTEQGAAELKKVLPELQIVGEVKLAAVEEEKKPEEKKPEEK